MMTLVMTGMQRQPSVCAHARMEAFRARYRFHEFRPCGLWPWTRRCSHTQGGYTTPYRAHIFHPRLPALIHTPRMDMKQACTAQHAGTRARTHAHRQSCMRAHECVHAARSHVRACTHAYARAWVCARTGVARWYGARRARAQLPCRYCCRSVPCASACVASVVASVVALRCTTLHCAELRCHCVAVALRCVACVALLCVRFVCFACALRCVGRGCLSDCLCRLLLRSAARPRRHRAVSRF